MVQDKYLYVIGGPTASGKTAKAIELALKLNTCIISADSRQFYREMNIGTAKPAPEELELIQHYFINNLSVKDNYNAGNYEEEVIELLERLFSENDVVIMAGGSGLFIKAVTNGLDDFPEIDPETRNKARAILEGEGLNQLQSYISLHDPDYYAVADIQNPRRLLRAAEIILQTGMPFSSFRKSSSKKRNFKIIKDYIDVERSTLYDRINNRVMEMIEAGLENEALSLMPYRYLTPLQTVGYQEWFEYFNGNISKDRAIELIQQNSRRYAKRQITWFKNDGGWSVQPPSLFF